VHQIEVNIVKTQVLQAGFETLLNAVVVRAPQLGGDEEILALDDSSVNGLLDALANLVLVTIAESTVNVTVTRLNSVEDSIGYLARGRLPSSQTKGRDLSSGVELETDVCGSHCVLKV
jgi:hypothetical protein